MQLAVFSKLKIKETALFYFLTYFNDTCKRYVYVTHRIIVPYFLSKNCCYGNTDLDKNTLPYMQ